MEFNINQTVRVKLTKRGKQLLRENFENFKAKYPNVTLKYTEPKEDKDGYSTWQMWNLMQELGQHIHMGLEPPFETTIILDIKDEP